MRFNNLISLKSPKHPQNMCQKQGRKSLMACLFLLFHSTVFLSCTTTLARNHTDQLALLAIKSIISEDPHHVLDSWNTSHCFCRWQCVTCGRRHRRVTKLDLKSRGMVGSLSSHVGNLSFLRVINVAGNTFKGAIPSQIGGLFRLQELILANNFFEGEVPVSLANCTRLRILRLGRNKLFGRIPQQLSLLVNLVIIAIQKNDFTGGIPSFLGNLTSLETISVSYNPLGGSIPRSLGQLHNLQQIEFINCDLYGAIPSSIYNLTSLVYLSFTNNQISGDLPGDIGLQLPNLEYFQIAGNKFTGSIPFSFSNCSNLVELNLGTNFFTGKVNINFIYMLNLRGLALYENSLGSLQPGEMSFIASLTNCSKLTRLLVHENQLRGVLPSTIGNLSSQLTELAFGGNFIYGNLPSAIGNLEKLEKIAMLDNQFSGLIPNELCNLENLKTLHISFNNFIGKVPGCMGNLSLLELDIGSNRLEGQIPPNIGKCKSLTYLDLSINNLTGPIPVELFQLPSSLIILYLEDNNLAGTLPQEIGKLKSLSELDLSHNNLVGAIPNTIGSCISLEYMHLEDNSFQGLIPLSMSALRGIRIIHLSSNNFSGQIPKFLEELNLSSLNLSFNKFYGEVPMRGIFKNTTAFNIEGNNRLCGGLPELRLPKCVMQTKSKKRSYTSLIVVVVVPLFLVLVAVVVLFLCFCLRRKTQPTKDSIMQPFSRISYGSILKATNGFSPQNMIGTGAFSIVYKGVLGLDGVMVAIKVLNLESQGALSSFMVECEALKNIRHRNLVKIITACSSIDFQGSDFKALIYEYMPNGNLDRWLHPSLEQDIEIQEAPPKLSLLQRLTILTDVAHAIHYLHQDSEVPIIHCDLKPTNILLDSDMVAHVSDFGMAKLLSLKPNESSSIGIRGTIGYAAPEYGLGSEMTKEGDIILQFWDSIVRDDDREKTHGPHFSGRTEPPRLCADDIS